jgi:hypothetical protein
MLLILIGYLLVSGALISALAFYMSRATLRKAHGVVHHQATSSRAGDNHTPAPAEPAQAAPPRNPGATPN